MSLTFNETKEILFALSVCPNKKLGQNFLIDQRVVAKSIEWASLQKGEAVVEIGPGCGTLTGELVNTGADVFAVEKDKAFYQYICGRYPTVRLVYGDALEVPVGSFDLERRYKVVANLPYAIASVWLDRILDQSQLPDVMVLLVQKEAADRWFSQAGTKSFCALSIALQSMYTLQSHMLVAKRCFYPQPGVDSVLLNLTKREDGVKFDAGYKQFLRSIFVHRRQQIGRACRETPSSFSNDFLKWLESRRIPSTIRAEAIELEDWVRFYQSVAASEY